MKRHMVINVTVDSPGWPENYQERRAQDGNADRIIRAWGMKSAGPHFDRSLNGCRGSSQLMYIEITPATDHETFVLWCKDFRKNHRTELVRGHIPATTTKSVWSITEGSDIMILQGYDAQGVAYSITCLVAPLPETLSLI